MGLLDVLKYNITNGSARLLHHFRLDGLQDNEPYYKLRVAFALLNNVLGNTLQRVGLSCP